MKIDKDVEKKLTELLIACHVTMAPRKIARSLIDAGVTVDPNLKHCYQCEHYLDCRDWNVCCSKRYEICYEATNACDLFEERTNDKS